MAVTSSRLGQCQDAPAASLADGIAPPAYQTFREFKDASGKAYFQVLLQAASSVSEAARLSGLSRGHLYEPLKKHGLDK